MTTSNKFFEKMFNENEKVIDREFYKSQTFLNYTNQELRFVSYLSVFSRYKNFLKNYLTNRHVRNDEKKNYLDVYRQTMSYEEYIKLNAISDNMRVCYENLFYVIGAVFTTGYLFYTYRSPSIYLKGKDVTKCFLAATSTGYSYYKYNYLNYSSELDKIYHDLSKRINDNPDIKLRPNKDFFEEGFDEGNDDY